MHYSRYILFRHLIILQYTFCFQNYVATHIETGVEYIDSVEVQIISKFVNSQLITLLYDSNFCFLQYHTSLVWIVLYFHTLVTYSV